MNKERGRGFRLVIEGKDFFFVSYLSASGSVRLFSLSASLCISFSLLFAFSTSTSSSSFFAFQIPARQATHFPSLLIMSALTNPTPPPPPGTPWCGSSRLGTAVPSATSLGCTSWRPTRSSAACLPRCTLWWTTSLPRASSSPPASSSSSSSTTFCP